MPLGSESGSVRRPFIRYAVEAGWKYLSPDEALNLRQGGVTSPLLDAVLLGQLTKLTPAIVNAGRHNHTGVGFEPARSRMCT